MLRGFIAALNHPNICQLYDVGPDYLVMECIEGTPLKGPSRNYVLAHRVNKTISFVPISAGDKLGPYEILAPLGAGGMGEVYGGRDTRLDRTVAVKALPEEIAKREDLHVRFAATYAADRSSIGAPGSATASGAQARRTVAPFRTIWRESGGRAAAGSDRQLAGAAERGRQGVSAAFAIVITEVKEVPRE